MSSLADKWANWQRDIHCNDNECFWRAIDAYLLDVPASHEYVETIGTAGIRAAKIATLGLLHVIGKGGFSKAQHRAMTS